MSLLGWKVSKQRKQGSDSNLENNKYLSLQSQLAELI